MKRKIIENVNMNERELNDRRNVTRKWKKKKHLKSESSGNYYFH